jgi:hypothetical protein
MSDEIRENEAVEETVDQPQSEPETQETENQEPESAQSAEDTDTQLTNNDDVPDKNAAWAAMRAENKRLKDALEESGVDEQYLADLRGLSRHTPDYQPTQVTPDDDYDKVTGTINQTNQVAASAYREVNQLKNTLREMEDRQAEMEYPELRTDPHFQQMVAERRLAMEIAGKRVATADIAKSVKRQLDLYREQISAQTREQVKQRQTEKQQAIAQPQTQSTQGKSSMTDEELRMRVRRGDEAAEIEMARRITQGMFE